MHYLTTGKRTTLEAEYQAQVNAWAKTMGISPPRVRVRAAAGGNYRVASVIIRVPPECSKETLVHEFAHHVADQTRRLTGSGKAGHGPAFRVALVQAATVAYGLAARYPRWTGEYDTVAAWARRHGLLKDVNS